jgi:serine/threonine-protein kinase
VAGEGQDLEPDPDISPQQIGGFRVLRRLASGATTDVLLARAEGPNGFERVVALKVLLQPTGSDPALEGVFAREASAYARLSHPAIVKLYDFFAVDGQLVMALEYVDGLPLHKLRATLSIGAERLEDTAALFVGSRVFSALAAAHSASDPASGEFSPVIHGDVNPSNVLVPWDGQVKVSDFAVSKMKGAQGSARMGFVKGTYGYQAPEQVRGGAVTVRTDVYSATLVLWELLARRKAIQRGSLPEAEVLKVMANPEIPPLDALRPDVSAEVRDAVRRGLEPDPDRRTVTAEEMANVLRKSMTGDEGRLSLAGAIARVRPPPASTERGNGQGAPPIAGSDPLPPASGEATGARGGASLAPAASEPKVADEPPSETKVAEEPPSEQKVADDPPSEPKVAEEPVSGEPSVESALPVPLTETETETPAAPPSPASPPTDASPNAPLPPSTQGSPSLVLVLGVLLGLALISVGGFRFYVHEQENGAPAPARPERLPPASVPPSSPRPEPKPPPASAAPSEAPSSEGAPMSAGPAATTPAPKVAGPGQGTILTDSTSGGHRIFVDGRVVGESPSPAVVGCGSHSVQVGSAGTARTVVVPCGGSVRVTP